MPEIAFVAHDCAIPGCRDPRWHAGMRRDQLGPQDTGKDARLGVYCVPDGYFAPGIAPTLDLSLGWKLSAGQNDAVNLDMSDAFVVFEFGSGDGADDNRVEVDLIRGQCVTLPARSVIGKLVYPIQPNPQNLFIQPALDISVSIAMGSGSCNKPPQRTVKVGNIVFVNAPVETNVFPIPPYARSAVLVTADNTVSLTINWYTQDEAAAPTGILVGQDTIAKLDRDGVPVPTGARGFTLVAGANVARAAVIFLVEPG